MAGPIKSKPCEADKDVEATGMGNEIATCLLLKIVQSPLERKPLCEAEEVAIVKVWVSPDEIKESPDKPEVAKNCGSAVNPFKVVIPVPPEQVEVVILPCASTDKQPVAPAKFFK